MSNKKPKIKSFVCNQSVDGFDLYEMCHYLSQKENVDFHDYYGAINHFEKWCDSKGYEEIDSVGTKRSSSQIFFAEYQKDLNGRNACPECGDVVDWFINEFMPEERIAKFNIDKSYLDNDKLPQYIHHFLSLLFDEFGDEVSLCYDLDS